MTVSDAVHILNNPSALPTQPSFVPGSERLVRLGEIAVFRAGWGFPITNQDMVRFYAEAGLDADEVAETVAGTGFKQGYYFPFEQDLFGPETQGWHAHYTAMLVEKVARARDWDHIDVLIVGSSTTRMYVLEEARQLLAQRGIVVDDVRMYVQACNSAIAGITDLSRDPQYHGIHAVVVGLETLSGDVVDIDTPTTFRVFGNGGGAIAFVPGKDIQHITGRTIAEYDTQGVIVGPAACPVAQIDNRIDHFDWYELVGEETTDKFVTSKDGVFIQIPPSDDGKLYMNGMSTLAYFAKRVSPLAVEIIQTYEAQFKDQYGNLGIPFGHQPSLPVVTFINHDLIRLDLEARGLDGRVARKLAKRGTIEEIATELKMPDYKPFQIPWIMDRTGFNNISAGTSLIAMVTMIEEGSIQPNSVLPVFGYGIGSVIQADIWKLNG